MFNYPINLFDSYPSQHFLYELLFIIVNWLELINWGGGGGGGVAQLLSVALS